MRKYITLILLMLLGISLGACQKEQLYQITIDYQNGNEAVIIETTGIVDLDSPIKEGYKFLGWLTLDGESFDSEYIEEDVTIQANWLKIGEKYSLFYDSKQGEMPSEFPNKYTTGSILTLPVPVKEYHAFEGWYLDVDYQDGPYYEVSDTMTGSKTFYAKWRDIAEYKQITYHLNGGSFPQEVLNKYIPGKEYRLDVPLKDNNYFRGWYAEEDFSGPAIKKIDSTSNTDLVLYAKWGIKKMSNTYISIYGDSISTFAGYLPEWYATYYPIEWVDVLKVEDTWWHQAIKKVGAKYHSNSSYSNTGVVTAGSAEALKGCDETRIASLEKNNQAPDIVIIFLGVNDCKRGIKASQFKAGYQQMIDRMKETYLGVELILCTLNACTFGVGDYEPLRQEYNQVIIELGATNNFKVARIDEVITESNKYLYMANQLHPNKAGMEQIALEVAKVIKEKK